MCYLSDGLQPDGFVAQRGDHASRGHTPASRLAESEVGLDAGGWCQRTEVVHRTNMCQEDDGAMRRGPGR